MTRDLDWLRDSLRAVDRVFFGDELERAGVRIGWMRWRRGKRVFRHGAWLHPHILVNPVLAHEWVPDEVVLYTIFHEGLHVQRGPDHDLGFRFAERRFPHYERVALWDDENLDRLLTATPPRLSRA